MQVPISTFLSQNVASHYSPAQEIGDILLVIYGLLSHHPWTSVVMYNLLLYKLCSPLVWCCTLLFVCLVTVGLLEYH